MATQHKSRLVKLTTILRRKAVVDGFNSIRKNKPFDYDACDRDILYGWGYERGRILAMVYDGPLKEGRYITQSACDAYIKAHAEGIIL